MKLAGKISVLIAAALIFAAGLIQPLPEVRASKTEEEPLVNMTLFQTDLREALKEISLQTGVNIIPDQTVGGVVTAQLEDVPLEKALQQILASGGYTYRKMDGFYLVGLPSPKSNTFSKLSKVEIVELKHVTVSEVMKVLPSFLRTYVQGDNENDVLTVSAPSQELKRIKELISKLDKPKGQVEVKVVITEVNSKEVKKLGTNLLEYNKNNQGEERASYSSKDNLLVLEADYYGQLISKLKLLEEEQKAKIKADPRLLVADGESAKLFVGDEENLIINSDNDDVESRVEEIEVGVALEVEADIIGQEEVKLKVSPEVSHFVDSARPDLVVKKNAISTALRLKSGQTAVLAGMTMENESSHNQGVPILNKVPVVRWLVSSKTEKQSSRQLLVFVTPIIE